MWATVRLRKVKFAHYGLFCVCVCVYFSLRERSKQRHRPCTNQPSSRNNRLPIDRDKSTINKYSLLCLRFFIRSNLVAFSFNHFGNRTGDMINFAMKMKMNEKKLSTSNDLNIDSWWWIKNHAHKIISAKYNLMIATNSCSAVFVCFFFLVVAVVYLGIATIARWRLSIATFDTEHVGTFITFKFIDQCAWYGLLESGLTIADCVKSTADHRFA